MLQQELSLRQQPPDTGQAYIQKLCKMTLGHFLCIKGALVATTGCHDHLLRSFTKQPAAAANSAVLYMSFARLENGFSWLFGRWLMASYAFIAIVYQGGASCIILAGCNLFEPASISPLDSQSAHDQHCCCQV